MRAPSFELSRRATAPRRMLAAAVAAVAVALAGCTASASNPHPEAHRAAAHHQERSRGQALAALRAGLLHPAHRAPYYLSLGDSLSVGIQPNPVGAGQPTAQGYPDQLTSLLHRIVPRLRLVKLGCSGETTVTMIHGGICGYPAGSQLAQATRFLRAHRGRVALITMDIGANDPNSCVIDGQLRSVFGCLSGRVSQTQRNLTSILARLRSAGGPRILIVGMTYYVPELALWRTSQLGKAAAIFSADFAAGVNRLLIHLYQRFGARVANVFSAFRSTDFGGPIGAAVRNRRAHAPPNVATVCALTWMCAGQPQGPNEHANAAGYRVIARTFWRTING